MGEMIERLYPYRRKWYMSKANPCPWKQKILGDMQNNGFTLLPHNYYPQKTQPVSLEIQAIMMFCILEGESIDIGQIILQNIICYMDSRKKTRITFPMLVTKLCARSGVHWDEQEETVQPKRRTINI